MSPCKHLDYSANYSQCKLCELDGFSCKVKYWERLNIPYKGAPIKVQFCKKRGRINDIFSCYNGEHTCYEPEK
jgi:hypothetical protein